MNKVDLSNVKLPEIKAGIQEDVYFKVALTLLSVVIVSSISFFLIKKAFA